MKIPLVGLFFVICFYFGSVNIPASEIKDDVEFQKPLLKCWEIKNKNILTFASDNEYLIYQSEDGQFTSIDKENKQEIWKISIGTKSENTLQIIGDGIYILNSSTEKENKNGRLTLRKINRSSGLVESIYDLPETSNQTPPAFAPDHTLLITSGKNISLVKIFDQKNFIWTKFYNVTGNKSGGEEKPSATEIKDDLFTLPDDDKISLYNTYDGSPTYWSKSTNDIISSILIYKNYVLWGDVSGLVFSFDSKTNTAKKLLRTGGKISWMEKLDDKILVTSDDNFVQLLSLNDKKVLWKKRLPGRINLKPKQTSNSIILNTTGSSEIYFLDKKDGKTFNQVTLNNDEFINDFQPIGTSIFILTNRGLYNYGQNCPNG